MNYDDQTLLYQMNDLKLFSNSLSKSIFCGHHYTFLQARSFLLKVPLKLKKLFDYCKTWDTSCRTCYGIKMPRSGAGLDARISFLSEDWLKSSLREHVMAISVGVLSIKNHSLAYNLIWQTLTYPACMPSNSIQEHLGLKHKAYTYACKHPIPYRLSPSVKYACKVDLRDSSIRPTCRYAVLSSFEVGHLAPGSKYLWYLRQVYLIYFLVILCFPSNQGAHLLIISFLMFFFFSSILSFWTFYTH
jgi:outer membrane protein insertion porin family